MNGITFYAFGSSPALMFAMKRLEQLGIAVTDKPGSDVTHCLLPIPTVCTPELESMLKQLPASVTLIGGNLPAELTEDYSTIDLLQDPQHLAENAAITADCAMLRVRSCMPTTFRDTSALVLGWGRIGKCLAHLLRQAGADVTVAARKESDIAMIQALGYRAEDIRKLHYGLLRYRVIFNTVPVPVITKQQAAHCRKDCILIDLASSPGIEGENVIVARGLPGKDAPESAGRLMARTIIRLLLGRECPS
ncbi:MAG: hypothetical protein E7439_06060 [Ruminococcaceae bacterium]|nr:hypothetical protein [Oscillospiraceae bacterium]